MSTPAKPHSQAPASNQDVGHQNATAIDALLDETLHALKLPTFVRNHASFADDALKQQHTYQKYLLALAEHEAIQRERNRHAQRIRAARFPVLKEIADFDFSAVPSLQSSSYLNSRAATTSPKLSPF